MAGALHVGRADTAARIVAALEAAGVIFVDENGEGPGVRLRKARPGDQPVTIAEEALNASNDQ